MNNRLFYESAAADFNSALPIGNGRLGAMVYGGAQADLLNLNEDSLWYGANTDRLNPDTRESIAEVRRLLREEKIIEAERLAMRTMTSLPKYFGPYQPLGDLKLDCLNGGEVSDYSRELDLERAVCAAKYRIGGLRVEKRYFASFADDMIVVRISADKPELEMQACFSRRPFEVRCDREEDTLIASGDCGGGGTAYVCAIRGQCDGKTSVEGDFLHFKDASEIVLYISVATDFYKKNPRAAVLAAIQCEYSYEQLLTRHIADYKRLFSRTRLSLGKEKRGLATDRLLADYESNAVQLIETYFDYSRYLMISASRPGSQAMNLQGIWNSSFCPPWESNYTININLEMNYWPGEIANLSECCEPLFDLIERMAKNGRRTAKVLYGCEGFVAHHCTNLYGDTAPEGSYFPSTIWPMGGAWLALHMWEHYLFTLDGDFLRTRAMPVMCGAMRFFEGYLAEDNDGFLVTGPTISPENTFVCEGGTSGLCMSSAIDNQILRELLGAICRAADIIGDEDAAKAAKEILLRLRPDRVNSYGGVMEWDCDREEAEPGHRHLSPLFGIYPGTSLNTEKMRTAALATLAHRRKYDGGKGYWYTAWMCCLYARLCKPREAYEAILRIFEYTTYTNLLCANPFQIDGNFGILAGICEMLLQSHNGIIEILPAIPNVWRQGSVCGLRARGGYTVDICWEGNTATSVKIKADRAGECVVRINGENRHLRAEADRIYELCTEAF